MRRFAILALAAALLAADGALALTHEPGPGIGPARGKAPEGPGPVVLAQSSVAVEPGRGMVSPGKPEESAQGPAPAAGDRFRKGMAILPYKGHYEPGGLGEVVDKLYDRLAGLGVDAVSISWPLFQESHTASEIGRGEFTPPDEDLRLMFRKAQERGWWVTFRPYLDESNFYVENKVWRGSLQPEDRQRWFDAYTRVLLDYARIAQETRVDTFIIGVEFNSLDGDPRWRDIIKAVRRVYSGQVTYAANWDHVKEVQFWDALDVIGVDSFYPLEVASDRVTVEAVTKAWRPWVEQVLEIKERTGKPVVFLELGITAQAGGLRQPWVWDNGAPVDLEAQRVFYEATCEVVRPLLRGMYWWVAFLTIEPEDPLQDRGHTPLGKPAEQEIRRCYAGEAVAGERPAAAAGSEVPRLAGRGQQAAPGAR